MEQDKSWKNNRQGNIELLAPAGCRDAFVGAVHAGADAVYMGGERFGARAYADNFTTEELVECIRYGHIYGCKSYLTVNTLMKEQELEEMAEALSPLYEAGLDGVIVQDIGALTVIQQRFPELELHASTQMTITGPAGARLLRELGVTRVVPARELSLEELCMLRQESGMEVEAFVHGAMCYSYSGACLLSSLLGGRSGNRGRCAQPCRLAYETDSPGAAVRKRDYYPLSLKDMCAIEHLPRLIESGIDSLKIEGRMKKPEYAAGVTAIYRKYIDLCMSYPQGVFRVEKEDLETLSSLYIRGKRQDGYFFKHNGREMVTLDSPSYCGSDEALLEQIRQGYIRQKKRIGVWVRAVFVCGEQAELSMGTGRMQVRVLGSVVEQAQNRPVLEEDIRRQLLKMGESCFTVEDLRIQTDESGFYSLKEINVLRREAVRLLEDRLIAGHGLTVRREPTTRSMNIASLASPADHVPVREDCDEMRIHVSTEEQLVRLAQECQRQRDSLAVGRLYVESHLLADAQSGSETGRQLKSGGGTRQALELLRAAGIAVWAALPYILRDKDTGIMRQALEWYHQERVTGFLIRNLEEYGWLEEQGETFRLQLDHTIYVWNSRTAAFWRQKSCELTCPLELNAREWRQLVGAIARNCPDSIPEKLVYGRIPVMQTANCIARTAGKCLRGQAAVSQGTLTDRYHKQFPVELRCDVCMNVIFNSVPLSLHREWDCCEHVYRRLSFTAESGEEMMRILDFFAKPTEMSRHKPPFKDYTTGHEKRGVL
ncbi:MAG: U32 family peptidase [bacterium]|nr:U32 family peptidase [bacterium]MCM1375710.1 U32 family peptidase [Muribaculum sp.]